MTKTITANIRLDPDQSRRWSAYLAFTQEKSMSDMVRNAVEYYVRERFPIGVMLLDGMKPEEIINTLVNTQENAGNEQ